jgi:hypothetical protein
MRLNVYVIVHCLSCWETNSGLTIQGIPHICGPLLFVSVFTSACHWYYNHTITVDTLRLCLRSINILHLHLGLPRGKLLSGFLNKICTNFLNFLFGRNVKPNSSYFDLMVVIIHGQYECCVEVRRYGFSAMRYLDIGCHPSNPYVLTVRWPPHMLVDHLQQTMSHSTVTIFLPQDTNLAGHSLGFSVV